MIDPETGKLISFVTASAGTGKTTRLVQEFLQMAGLTGAPVDSSKVIAVTFTRKAATELRERARQELMFRHNWWAMAGLQQAYVGTVHSVCTALVRRFSINCGLSPRVHILEEDDVLTMMAESAHIALQLHAEELEPAAHRLGFWSWLPLVMKICSSARTNGISSEALQHSAERSWLSLRKYLNTQVGACDAQKLDLQLKDAIASTLPALRRDDTSLDGAITELQRDLAVLDSGEHLTWPVWARLSKLLVPGNYDRHLKPVRHAASCHSHHPRLHDDIKIFIHGIFRCAAEVMDAYQNFKNQSGYLDFADQEAMALAVLQNEEALKEIRSNLNLVLVDEFQDTSPIQLAIFSSLAGIAPRSLWVGDEKQAIYSFRGTDPALVREVIQLVYNGTDQGRENLSKSFRSRKGLIEFTNDLFHDLLPGTGISPESIRIQSTERIDFADQDTPLQLFWMCGDNWEQALKALAEEIKELVSGKKSLLIVDKVTGQPVCPTGRDIAILCRTNNRCMSVAAALRAVGLEVAVKETGLLETPECILALAALRFLVDKRDSLAIAEILKLTEQKTSTDSGWLEQMFSADMDSIIKSNTMLYCLNEARLHLKELTPTETLDTAMGRVQIFTMVKKWGNHLKRQQNLEQLRGLAMKYEHRCLVSRRGASAAGLVNFLHREVSADTEQPGTTERNAVRVLTYHSAKGLEWPIVILADLQEPAECTPFGINVVREYRHAHAALSDGCWIRFWPWPYGAHRRNVFLDESSKHGEETTEAHARMTGENLRLLYVAMTRARDYLILAGRAEPARRSFDIGWLSLQKRSDGSPLLKIPTKPGLQNIQVASVAHPIVVRHLQVSEKAPESPLWSRKSPSFHVEPPQSQRPSFAPYFLRPSSFQVEQNISKMQVVPSTYNLGTRLKLLKACDIELLGDALHLFLGADDCAMSFDDRIQLACDILDRWSLADVIEPSSFTEAGDRLMAFMQNNFNATEFWREQEITARLGGQRASGRIDLIGLNNDGYIVVDHKAFPGRSNLWTKKAIGFAPQLYCYSKMLEQTTGRIVVKSLIHLPVVGTMVDLTPLVHALSSETGTGNNLPEPLQIV